MNILLKLAFLFYVGSTIGWLIELFYRRLVSSKKWINPGFLTGPYLPIYGFGLCILYLVSSIPIKISDNYIIQDISIIILMTVAMTAIEYVAGKIFIKILNVKLWDYSDRLGNIESIICPLYSAMWGIVGAIYYFFIHKKIINALEWFSNNLAFSFVIGFFFGFMVVDLAHSLKLAVKLRKFAKKNIIYVKFEQLKEYIREEQEKSKQKINYLFAFKTNISLSEILSGYVKKYKNLIETQEIKKKINEKKIKIKDRKEENKNARKSK